MGSCIEVRLLGRLQVRRADGTLVANSEWRTGKTADLVRILTLAAGRPVRNESLLDALWPGVEEAKARASLRTAASQIRRTLDADCVERSFDGLALAGVWSDVESFITLAAAARTQAREGNRAQVVRIAREAEALYTGDVDCHVHTDLPWVTGTREHVASLRRDLLTDAAECALQLAWYRDAEDLARRAHEAEPMAERPYRLLMSAYAGLGETDRALRTYDLCRRTLATELGADPSPLTQAVHAQILRGVHAPRPLDACPPPASTVSSLHAALLAAGATNGLHLLALDGAERVHVAAALTAAADSLVRAGWSVRRFGPATAAPTAETVTDPGPTLITLPDLDQLDHPRLVGILAAHRTLATCAPVVVVTPTRVPDEALTVLEGLGVRVLDHEVAPLDHASLAALAQDLLGSPVTPTFVKRLYVASGGLLARAAETVQTWRGEGRIVSTGGGLDLTAPFAADAPTPAGRTLCQLSGADAELAGTLAALRKPAGVTRLLTVLQELGHAADLGDVIDGLDRMVDARVLQLGDHGYEFVCPLTREAAESWLRPAARRRIHRVLAASDLLRPEDRALQWTLAGEPVAAIECLLDATELAVELHDRERAAALVCRAATFASGGSWDPRTQLEVLETLGSTAARLGLSEIARRVLDRGLEVAATCNRDDVARLRRQRDALDRPQLVPAPRRGVDEPRTATHPLVAQRSAVPEGALATIAGAGR